MLAYNLCVLFQRHVGWEDRVTTGHPCGCDSSPPAGLSAAPGLSDLRLAVREGPLRAWWQRLFEKLELPVAQLHCS